MNGQDQQQSQQQQQPPDDKQQQQQQQQQQPPADNQQQQPPAQNQPPPSFGPLSFRFFVCMWGELGNEAKFQDMITHYYLLFTSFYHHYSNGLVEN